MHRASRGLPKWIQFGTHMGQFWDHFETILGPIWYQDGTIFGQFWDQPLNQPSLQPTKPSTMIGTDLAVHFGSICRGEAEVNSKVSPSILGPFWDQPLNQPSLTAFQAHSDLTDPLIHRSIGRSIRQLIDPPALKHDGGEAVGTWIYRALIKV